jgi:HD-like signal output (HDOD) protein
MTGEAGIKQRKAAVLAILTEGLPPMPDRLRQLAALLTSNPVDLKQVASVIRADRHLTSKLFRWSEAIRANRQSRVNRIEEAAILVGAERMKNMVFANYLISLAGNRLRQQDLERFWTHSLATAALSEPLARAIGYDDAERAYLGGVMHDSGKLPLLMAVAGEANSAFDRGGRDDKDALRIEREHFGFDHCQVGRGLGIAWNFDHGLIEVLEWHHEPEKARFDPELVAIVATAEHFLDVASASAGVSPFAIDDFYRSCFPRLSDEELEDLVSMLGREYARTLRHADFDFQGSEPAIPSEMGRTNK